MHAAMHNNAEIAQLLIEKNANVNIAANTGITALAILSAQHGSDFRSARFRDLLIKAGAQ
jgi:ankyrin repeat protein